jgi:hypothetical protein
LATPDASQERLGGPAALPLALEVYECATGRPLREDGSTGASCPSALKYITQGDWDVDGRLALAVAPQNHLGLGDDQRLAQHVRASWQVDNAALGVGIGSGHGTLQATFVTSVQGQCPHVVAGTFGQQR